MTPTLTTPAGALALSYWADKSATTAGWTVPDTLAVRRGAPACGTGAGHVCSVLADSAGPVAAGTYGRLGAAGTAASSTATMWTIVLRPTS